MFDSSYDKEYKNEVSFFRKHLVWIVLFFMVLSTVGWMVHKATNVADSVIDNALINYEQFQEVYNTCSKLNSDLATIRTVPDSDKMFDSFSKQAMIANKKQQLGRWVEDYNAKSKMWNRSLWKSSSLPYQLNVNDFSNYNQ